MKIVQNPESGELNIQLEQNEKYDIEEHLDSLMKFASKQAIKTHKLSNSHNELVNRLNECERKLSKLNKK